MGKIVAIGPATVIPSGASTDDQVIGLWLHGRSKHTVRAYQSDVDRFRRMVPKALSEVSVRDLQAFEISEDGLADASRSRSLSAVKSLLTFAQRIGYIPFNVGAVVKLPKVKNTLSNRILEERDVILMMELEPSDRNKTILETLYFGGLRISELCSLTWVDVQRNSDAGQLTVFGKGGKTRVVKLPARVYQKLSALRSDQADSDPVFLSREKGALSPEQVHRIVHSAAKRAGIDRAVSAHWLRHAHASHALDNGAPIHLVQATLGHASLTTTSRYVHAKPNESSGMYLKA